VSVRLRDVIGVLDEAYPPRLAHAWDSVGLVCGDPDDTIDSVTVAVDATAAVVDAVGERGLLLAHHPLLLRGVDTVAASTPKGDLIHRLIRRGGALFTAHTNADAANPGVSDALAGVLGLDVEAVLDPAPSRADLDKWVIYVPPDSAESLGSALFAAGVGRIGDSAHHNWTLQGTGQLHQLAEDRLEVIAPSSLRSEVLTAMRRAHPDEEPAFSVVAMAPLSSDVGIGRIGTLPRPERFIDFVVRVKAALPQTTWGVRAAGDPDAMISRVAVSGGAGDSLLAAATAAGVHAYVTSDIRHHPADEYRRSSDVALVDVAHWASEFPWCTQAARLLQARFGSSLAVSVCDIRTDPWNIDVDARKACRES